MPGATRRDRRLQSATATVASRAVTTHACQSEYVNYDMIKVGLQTHLAIVWVRLLVHLANAPHPIWAGRTKGAVPATAGPTLII